MIPNGEGQYQLAVKTLAALLTGITSKQHGNFCCLNCFCSFSIENKHESHEKVYKNKHFCDFIMSSEDSKILKFNQYQISDKISFAIDVDCEYLVEKINECENNPENTYTIKLRHITHIPSSFSMSTIKSVTSIENKHDVYRGKDCMKKFC